MLSNPPSTTYHPKSAFTLVELLVVMTIIGILISLLLPAVQAARESARRMQCANNLKQIGLALHGYHTALGSFPIGNINRTAGNCPGQAEPTTSYSTRFGNWMIAILPYLEQSALYDSYKPAFYNTSNENKAVRETVVSSYVCPSDLDVQLPLLPTAGPAVSAEAKYAPGSYRAVSGCTDQYGIDYLDSEMMNDYDRTWRGPIHMVLVFRNWKFTTESLDSIRDGASNTLLVGESTTTTEPGRRTFWAYSYAYYTMSAATPQARTLWGDYARCTETGGNGNDIPCRRQWGSLHSGILNFALCDGSVRPIHVNINTTLFANLSTIAGSETAQVPE